MPRVMPFTFMPSPAVSCGFIIVFLTSFIAAHLFFKISAPYRAAHIIAEDARFRHPSVKAAKPFRFNH